MNMFNSDIEGLRLDAVRLNSIAKDALSLLLRNLTSSPISRLSYAYTARVKTEHGILEKIKRKREGSDKAPAKADYQLTDITDIVGIRFVTLYRNEIGKILEYILSELSNSPIPGSTVKSTELRNMFSPNSLKETIIYTNNTHDIFVPRWENLLHRVCAEKLQKKDQADYSSIHIVASLATPEGTLIPIEIQIRSVFDDAWGQLNHAFQYASQSGKSTDVSLNNPAFIHKLLSNLKQFTDACGNYADLIYEEAYGDAESVTSAVVIDLQDSNAVIQLFRKLKINEQLVAEYRAAVQSKEQVDSEKATKQLQQDTIDSMYYQAASNFRKVITSSDTFKSSEELDTFKFYAMLNEALCYLSSSTHVARALELYSELMTQKSEHPMLLFRYGQALEKNGDPSNGVEFVRKAWEAAKISSSDQKRHDKNFLHQDLLHLCLSAPRKIGFSIWHQAEKSFLANNIDTQTFGERLILAYNISREGLDFLQANKIEHSYSKKDLISIHNNLLYYATELLRLAVLDESNKQLWLGRVKEHLAILESDPDAMQYDILRMDTVWRTYQLLGDFDRCMSFANRVLEMSLDPAANSSLNDEVLRKVAGEALRALKQLKAK